MGADNRPAIGAEARGLLLRPPPLEQHIGGLRALRWEGGSAGGDDRLLVFLHGIGDGADTWRPVLSRWPGRDRPEAIALALPGHWGSDPLASGRYAIEEVAEVVARSLEDVRADRMTLIGHSLGARIALDLVSSGRIEVDLLVLVDMSPDRDDKLGSAVSDHIDLLVEAANTPRHFVERVSRELPLADPAALAEVLPALLAAGSGENRGALDPAVKALLRRDETRDEWALLGAVRSPVAILRGAFSSALRGPTAHRMALTARCCAGFGTIPRAGHAIPLEQPRALARAIAGFLDVPPGMAT